MLTEKRKVTTMDGVEIWGLKVVHLEWTVLGILCFGLSPRQRLDVLPCIALQLMQLPRTGVPTKA
jgi:hypothetical protein